MTKQLPWGRIAAEGVVIVVSILVAFAIDRWWERQAQYREQEAVLSVLASEFESSLQTISERRVYHEEDTAAARRILSATGPEAVSGDAPALVDDIQTLMGVPSLRLSIGTIERTLEADQADLLGPGLRQALTSWVEDVATLRSQNDYLEEVNSDFYGFLVGRYPTRNLFTDFGRASRFGFDPVELLRDIRFESVVHGRGDASVLILDQADYLRDSGTAILAILRQAQGHN